MRYPRGEDADALELLGLAHSFIELPPIGEVADHLGVPVQLAVFPKRDHDARSPEAASVLSEMPTLVLGPTLVSRGLKLYLRHTGMSVRRNEDLVGRSTFHLVGLVPKQLLRSIAPATYAAVRIEENDTVILGRRKEQVQQIVRHIPSTQLTR